MRIDDILRLKERFLALLDQKADEQVYQDFIEKNTPLVPREFVQNHGIYMDLVLRKLSLSSDYTPDFCYLSKSSDDWNIVLIEIEKPQSRYFRDSSTRFHPDFQAALEQITHWRAWFSIPANFNGFVNGTLGTIRGAKRENPCKIKYVLVHGRRAEAEGNDIRNGLIRGMERDDFQIMSYDSLVEDLSSHRELYLGVKKNEYIEILSNKYISEPLFIYLPPSYLRITDELRRSTLDHKNSWQFLSSLSPHRYDLDERLPQIAIIPDIKTF